MADYWLVVGIPAGVIVLVIGLALFLDWGLYRYDKKLQAVRDMDIGEGVTLAEGIDAYYGGRGEWDVFDQGDVVRVAAGMRGPRAMLRFFPKTGEIMIWDGSSWDDITEREVLFAKLVKAVKEQKDTKRPMGPDPVRQDVTYRVLNGFLERDGTEPSSDTMQLMFMAEQIYQHRVNLCERAGLDFEDKELEAIITLYEKMNRMCAEMMYNSGWHDGNRTYAMYEL